VTESQLREAHERERAGLSHSQVVSLTAGTADDECWADERDRLLIRSVDSLHEDADIPDGLWQALADVLTEENLLDLLLLCGWYHAISFAARAARVPQEAEAPTFESIRDRRAPADRKGC
jgi:hypothetical protein